MEEQKKSTRNRKLIAALCSLVLCMLLIGVSVYAALSQSATITNTISEYLKEIRTEWANYSQSVVRISQIETKILAIHGVLDITNTKINGSSSNLSCGTYEIPVFGGVSA